MPGYNRSTSKSASVSSIKLEEKTIHITHITVQITRLQSWKTGGGTIIDFGMIIILFNIKLLSNLEELLINGILFIYFDVCFGTDKTYC
jgi:hypothetical protein